MPYATPEDVRDALAPTGDTTQASAASLDDEQIEDSIAEATTEIDARVTGAPFEDGSVPPIIGDVARDIAAYLATLVHRKGAPLPQDHPVRLRYVRARDLLGELAAGRIDLEPPNDPGETTVINRWEGDFFTLDDLGLGIRR